MPNHTLTYSESSEGFPSFYSYYPDFMIGMNNYFYSFKGGNLYRHNVNETRNNFYGIQYTSQVKSVFNASPLENKLFKTLNLEGDNSWEAYMRTDIQDSGYIDGAWFEKKEGAWFAFVRNLGTVPANISEYALRSLNGIGRSSVVVIGSGTATIDFPLTVQIGNILSIGDMFYFGLPPNYNSPQLAGQVTQVNINLRAGINQVEINTDGATFNPTVSPSPVTVPISIEDAYFLYIKNAVAESHGVLGHYCIFDIENGNTAKTELFSVESEVMKSFP
jgi:hypothetical protein